MLLYFLLPLSSIYSIFNVFKYLTFRAMGAVLTALVFSFVIGPRLIGWLRTQQTEGQPIRLDGPASHLLTKKGTPTMGGVLILCSLSFSVLLWSDLTNYYVWMVLLMTLGFGVIGAVDDYLKLFYKNSKGISAKHKLIAKFGLSFLGLGGMIIVSPQPWSTIVTIPFFKNIFFDLGPFFIVFGAFVIVGASNAVNFTDGLDGLAIVPVMITAGCFCLISYLIGNSIFSNYLQLPFIPGSGELSVFCAALVGSSLGFLWFNAPPASVFMGDTGSLALGGALGTISVITKHELVLAIIGGVFVIETFSVIIQVLYYRRTGKRVFLMAPIHHHFEKLGWSESTIVVRFWIISTILAIIGLSSLKLR